MGKKSRKREAERLAAKWGAKERLRKAKPFSRPAKISIDDVLEGRVSRERFIGA